MLEAKTKLSQLVEAAERGEQVFLQRNGVPVAQIVPVPKEKFPFVVSKAIHIVGSIPESDLKESVFDSIPKSVMSAKTQLYSAVYADGSGH